MSDLYDLQDASERLRRRFTIVIAQSGLSKAGARRDRLELGAEHSRAADYRDGPGLASPAHAPRHGAGGAPHRRLARRAGLGGRNDAPYGGARRRTRRDDIPELMEDLMGFIARGDVDPITAAAVAHAQFETIHPFADGNGRSGRVIIG